MGFGTPSRPRIPDDRGKGAASARPQAGPLRRTTGDAAGNFIFVLVVMLFSPVFRLNSVDEQGRSRV